MTEEMNDAAEFLAGRFAVYDRVIRALLRRTNDAGAIEHDLHLWLAEQSRRQDTPQAFLGSAKSAVESLFRTTDP